ncbi:MAG: hypothetical protein SV108_03895 [Pseudomonadota bacterium]|nr:hypothetical protein [Pseudomonadota bacterium]HJO36525.1 hypothetical protein [Gammaproteobacteria bacterium]
MPLPALIAALLLAGVHLFAHRLRFLHGIPRSRWLSMAGGASIAYVFLHLLPELGEGQDTFGEHAGERFAFLDHHIYLIALVGLVLFYGLERLARTHGAPSKDQAPPAVFWIHIGSFTLYNALIGYLLLHGEGDELQALALFALAMGLHFLVNDFGMLQQYAAAYEHRGRWLLSAAVLGGWLLGCLTRVPALALAAVTAFLAGGVILNVMKEELPEERRSRFSAFLLGAAGYGLLLLLG